MPNKSYSIEHNNISDILHWIDKGTIGIPEMQRPFVWSTTQVRDLIDSLYRGYPIGFIVTWQNPDASLKMGGKGQNKEIIIDGQQRITALSAALMGKEIVDDKYLKKRIYISFNPITEEFGMNPVLDMKKRQELPVVGYYGMFELTNGFRKELYWPKEQMEEHAKTYSKGYASDLRKHTSYTFWTKNFDAMAKKTLIRQLISKWGIMSVEMQKAYEADMGVLDEDGTVRYVDNEQDIVADVEAEIAENSNKEEFVVDEPPVIEGKTAPKTVADVTTGVKEKETVKAEKKQEYPPFMAGIENME